MRVTMLALACAPLFAACAATQHAMPHYDRQASAQAFETLKSLAGRWTGTAGMGADKQTVEATYEVVSAGSVVMERLFPGTAHEMVTMYHRDGDRLLMTHYCSAGNQPRMELVHFSEQPEKTLAFAFTDATNWSSSSQMVMHDLRLSTPGPNHLIASWTAWENGKPGHTGNFELSRFEPNRERQLGY